MLKILFITPRYYPHIGGVEYVVKSVVEELVKMPIFVQIKVLAGSHSISKVKIIKKGNMEVIYWPTIVYRESYFIPKYKLLFEKYLLKLSKDIDIIHIHNVHSVFAVQSYHVLKKCNYKEKVLVVTPYYHGKAHSFFRNILWPFWKKMVKELLLNADKVHTVSKYEAYLVKKDFNVKAIPIENGVSDIVFKYKWCPENYVLYSGRIVKYKNIHILGKLVAILNKEYGYDLEFKIIGNGPYLKDLVKYLKKINIKYSIYGYKPYKEYLEVVSKAKFMGLLSSQESFPQSVNEANAIGTPVIVNMPWGINFKNRPRTLVVDLYHQNIIQVANKVQNFMLSCNKQPRPIVKSWKEIAKMYVEKLYNL
ncbi:glycosyltransferase family 4 protein [Desulfurococcaceae archaeon MEX13E-LK6-19]|nr:glycosyltransferase family 4 protein [Desulfurococcaceae archaeon MEX13E-LK6-19]